MLGLILSLLVGSGFLFAHQFRVVVRNEAKEDQIISALALVHRVTDDIQDSESGQRGYMLTSNEDYLKPYYAGINDADDAIVQLREAAALDKNEKVDELIDLIEESKNLKFAELAKTIELQHKGKKKEAHAIIVSNVGLQYMSNMRHDIDLLLNIWRVKRKDLRYDTHKRITLSIAAFGGLAISIVFLLAWSIWTQKNAYEEIKDHMEYLDHQASHDPLTDLSNRRKLLADIDELERINAETVGLIYIDIDGFKSVNDKMGHDAGDVLLQKLSKAFKLVARPADTLARIGGDEFVFLIPGYASDVELVEMAKRIIESVEAISVKDYKNLINASVGIATYKSRVESIQDLLGAADGAMYQSKRSGRGRFNFSDNKNNNERNRTDTINTNNNLN